jgi:hypothetical protein
MKTRILFFLLMNFFGFALAQSNQDFKVIDFENKFAVSATELSPDGKSLAIGTANGPIYFFDIETQKITRTLPVSGYKWGPYMHFSKDGKYLLLIEQYYTNFTINKDRPSRVEVMDVASGKILISKENVHSAVLAPDNKTLVTLKDDEVVFWNIESGKEEKKFKPGNPTNSIAISANGDVIVVSEKSTEADLKTIPSIREDKKAIKEALKFREVAVFYDANTFVKKFIANDIFDIIFSMQFSENGNTLYLFNAPNRNFRATQGAARNGYIQSVDPANGEVSRTIFATGASEPQYKESAEGKYFASTSIEQKFRVLNSVNVFEKESGSMVKNFVNDFRLGEDVHTGRASFEFLPDHNTIALGYGTKLVLWKFKE